MTSHENSDLEVPQDGRDSQPGAQGSSDEPETLEEEDPLRGVDAALAETDSGIVLEAQESDQGLEEETEEK